VVTVEGCVGFGSMVVALRTQRVIDVMTMKGPVVALEAKKQGVAM